MSALVRSASLLNFSDVAAQCGLDARRLTTEAGLPQRCLVDPDLMIPVQAVGYLLELAAQRAGEPAFGLRMAATRRLSSLGALGLAVRDEPTLRHALEALIQHIHLHVESMVLQVEQVGQLVLIREEVLIEQDSQTFVQATEMAVGTTLRVLAIFLGAAWHPQRVCFTHEKPEKTTAHRQIFGCPVVFGSEFNGLVCKASDLDVPNPGADQVMSRYTQHILQQAPQRKMPMSDRVRKQIVLLLPRGHCRVEIVAQHMGLDRRTIAKYLAREETSFSMLVNEVRKELLSRYLQDGQRPLTEVSQLLGFGAPSGFSRWHREQFGYTARSRREGLVG